MKKNTKDTDFDFPYDNLFLNKGTIKETLNAWMEKFPVLEDHEGALREGLAKIVGRYTVDLKAAEDESAVSSHPDPERQAELQNKKVGKVKKARNDALDQLLKDTLSQAKKAEKSKNANEEQLNRKSSFGQRLAKTFSFTRKKEKKDTENNNEPEVTPQETSKPEEPEQPVEAEAKLPETAPEGATPESTEVTPKKKKVSRRKSDPGKGERPRKRKKSVSEPTADADEQVEPVPVVPPSGISRERLKEMGAVDADTGRGVELDTAPRGNNASDPVPEAEKQEEPTSPKSILKKSSVDSTPVVEENEPTTHLEQPEEIGDAVNNDPSPDANPARWYQKTHWQVLMAMGAGLVLGGAGVAAGFFISVVAMATMGAGLFLAGAALTAGIMKFMANRASGTLEGQGAGKDPVSGEEFSLDSLTPGKGYRPGAFDLDSPIRTQHAANDASSVVTEVNVPRV